MKDLREEISLFTQAYEMIFKKLMSWFHTFALMIPNFISAILIFLAFSLLARVSKKMTHKILLKTTISEDIIRILTRILSTVIIMVGLFFCLGVLHLEKTVTSLLAGAGIIGLALSFAFQDLATNLISGFMLAVKKPFKVGDHVETNSYSGIVSEIDIRAIHIKTFEGQEVIIPSKEVFQKPIKNFTTYGERRIEFTVGIAYTDDLEKVANLARVALESVPGRDTSKSVEVYFDSFGETSVNLILRLWVNLSLTKNASQVKHLAIINIQKLFRAHSIDIPLPARLQEEVNNTSIQPTILKLEDSNI